MGDGNKPERSRSNGGNVSLRVSRLYDDLTVLFSSKRGSLTYPEYSSENPWFDGVYPLVCMHKLIEEKKKVGGFI
jgi:hypothetical protein